MRARLLFTVTIMAVLGSKLSWANPPSRAVGPWVFYSERHGCTLSIGFEQVPTPRGPELWLRKWLSDCELDYSTQLIMLDGLLADASRQRRDLSKLKGLDWGAMHEPQIVVRAASANIRTTGGKPMGEFAFRDTIERVGVFSDLRAIFRKHGLNLAVADVEEAEAFNVAKLRQMGLDREMLRRLSPGMQITAGAEFLRFRLTPL